jgi:tripeptide aminopeptidase
MQDVTIDKSIHHGNFCQYFDVPNRFVSHFDYYPDFTGANVKPQIISNYDGKRHCIECGTKHHFITKLFKDLLYKGKH